MNEQIMVGSDLRGVVLTVEVDMWTPVMRSHALVMLAHFQYFHIKILSQQ